MNNVTANFWFGHVFEEQLHWCTVQQILDGDNMPVWLSKMVLSLYLCTGCRGWQRVLQSQIAFADWLDCFIGPVSCY
jgi:hypothetical protein